MKYLLCLFLVLCSVTPVEAGPFGRLFGRFDGHRLQAVGSTVKKILPRNRERGLLKGRVCWGGRC